jgi:hypothetical protein
MRRGADALAQTVGCATVQLQMPALPVAGDDGEELGLRTPEFQVRLLGPVALRRSGKTTAVLVPADTLEALLGVAGAGAVRVAMESVSAVLVGDASFALGDVEVVTDAGGGACLYRLVLEGEGIEVT